MNTSGTGKNANIDGKEGTKKGKPPHKKATKASQIKMSQNKGDKAIPKRVHIRTKKRAKRYNWHK